MPPDKVCTRSVLAKHATDVSCYVQIITEGRFKEIPVWFPGARLNYAENLLCHDGDAIAMTGAREHGEIVHYTFRQLRHLVRDMAAAMRVNGLQVGDRVAGSCHNE